MIVPETTNGANGDKKARMKENLQTAFIIVALVSFSLTIAVNFYTLRRLSGK
jgi:hypothetical protein